MDFASAEGANEAGRRAANGVLESAGEIASPVKVWPRDEIGILVPFQRIDRYRFERGEPQLELPEPVLNIIEDTLIDA